MSKNNDIRVVNSKEWILGALSSLLLKSDYETIMIKDIIEKSGVSKSTFHRHFKNKDEVLKEFIKEKYNETTNKILELSNGFTSMDFKGEYIVSVFDIVHQNKELFKLLENASCRKVLIDVVMEQVRQRSSAFDLASDQIEITIIQSRIILVAMIDSLAEYYLSGFKQDINIIIKAWVGLFPQPAKID